MYCNRCGTQNEPGNNFCNHCGTRLTATPPDGQQSNTGTGIQKKRRTGLKVGLAAGTIALIAAVYFLFLSAPNLDGIWVCKDQNMALQFENGMMTEYSLSGADTAAYRYLGEGHAKLLDEDIKFSVKDEKMSLTIGNAGEQCQLVRQDDANVEEVVKSAIPGMWSSEEFGEVIEMTDSKVTIHSADGDESGSYDFDVKNGKGTIKLEDGAHSFTVRKDAICIEDWGEYNRSDIADIGAFVQQYRGVLTGIWVEKALTSEKIVFRERNMFSLVGERLMLAGLYKYESKTKSGTMTFEEPVHQEYNFSIDDDNKLIIDDLYDFEELMSGECEPVPVEIKGRWKNKKNGKDTVYFDADGVVTQTLNGKDYTGLYSYYDDIDTGAFSVDYGDGEENIKLELKEPELYLGDQAYIRGW